MPAVVEPDGQLRLPDSAYPPETESVAAAHDRRPGPLAAWTRIGRAIRGLGQG